MKQVVYIDVLIFLNIIINYLLLLSTAFITRSEIKRLRVLAGSAIGGVYSLIIFLPPLSGVFSAVLKLALSGIIVIVSFGDLTPKAFLRQYSAFFAANFVFAGVMLAIWFAFKPGGMVINNATVYFNISAAMLVLSAVAGDLILILVFRLFRRNAPDSHIFEITIEVSGKSITGKALLDTGNALKDGFSGKPVIIAEYLFVKPLLPPDVAAFFEDANHVQPETMTSWNGRIRLIPFQTVKDRGMLPAFKPDKVVITGVGKRIETQQVYVASTCRRLADGEYRVLLGNGVFRETRKERKGDSYANADKRRKSSERASGKAPHTIRGE